MRISLPLAALFSAVILSGCENPEQRANALFVEAAQALTTAHGVTEPFQQYDQLVSAKAAVSKIVADFPGTSAAVRISANEKVGPYSLADLNAAIAALAQRPEFCLRTLTKDCLADMVLTSLDKLLEQDRSQKPDEALAQVAIIGLPFANIVAQERVNAVFAASPEGEQANGQLMAKSFGYPPMTAVLLNMVATAKGEQALVEAITALKRIPGFTQAALQSINRVAFIFLQNRTPNSATLLKAAANALQNPLPEEAAKNLRNEICKLSTEADKNALVIADCTPAELIESNTYFGHLPAGFHDRLYEAATTPQKKQDIATKIYSSGNLSVDQRFAWLDRTTYTSSLWSLGQLYIDATREAHPARATLAPLIEAATAKKDTLDSPALVQAGVTGKTILLLHANGGLSENLAAIYQNIEAQPRYTVQLAEVLQYLAELQPYTPGMDQATFFRLLGKTVATWPDDKSASRDAAIHAAFKNYPADADPRPAFDTLYAGKPYIKDLWPELLLRFKSHGHIDIYDKAVAASKPMDDAQSLLYFLARKEIYEAAEAGDSATVITKLEALPFFSRYYILGHLMQKENKQVSQKARDAMLAPLLQKYAYELSCYEFGWHNDLGVPLQTKLDIFSNQYAKVKDFIKVAPSDWFIEKFADFSPEQRKTALNAMHRAGEKDWPLFAGAIALVDSAK